MITSLREAAVAMLLDARARLENQIREGESAFTAVEWQKGYVKALEDVLDLEGLSQRRYPRQQTTMLAQVARVPPAGGHPEQTIGAKIADLSAGGCRLATATELLPGESITLTFTLPGRSTAVEVEGQVLRAERSGDQLWAGVEFQGIPEGIVEALYASCPSAPSAATVAP